MRNILITWILPTAREQGGPLPVEEILHAAIELSADNGASYSLVGEFVPSTLSAPVNDLPFSDQYIARGRVFDTNNQPGAYITRPFVVSDNSPPGVLEITVDLT